MVLILMIERRRLHAADKAPAGLARRSDNPARRLKQGEAMWHTIDQIDSVIGAWWLPFCAVIITGLQLFCWMMLNGGLRDE